MTDLQKPELCILVVDDEPKNIQLLANLLREQGYTIEFATSGAEALHWVGVRSFDLILLDVMMPELDGFTVCRYLKTLPHIRDVPVIFLTAKTDTQSVVAGFACGAVDYITKPFQKEELLARTKTHITLFQQQRELNRYSQLLEEKYVELDQKNSQLNELNTHKDKFFSIIAHDLKSPFVSFLLFGELLENSEAMDPAEFKTLIGSFQNSAKNLFNLLDNLLTWSRMQRGLMEYAPEELPLGTLVEKNVELLLPGAQLKQIAVTNQVPKECDGYGDLQMIDAVIRNLLANAIKFTHRGGQVTIAATVDDKMITLAVADTGIGIPEEHLTTLFRIDAKYQLKGTAGEIGTGLGLILCKDFVEKNGGKVWVKSEFHKGSTFSFTVPLLSKKNT